MARKGDLMATTHLNVGLDAELDRRLRESALKYERTLTQEARYALRKHLGMDATPVEDSAGVVD
jgi:hypothetical protein